MQKEKCDYIEFKIRVLNWIKLNEKEIWKREHICIYIADLVCYSVEINTTFYFIYFFLPNLHFIFYFNWRLITLWYCSGFCHTLTWISHGCTCVPHPERPLPTPSPSNPSGSSQCTSPEHPVSCIKPGPAIYFTYDIMHVSMLFSQIIPPSPSPTESKSLFFTSVSFLLSCI